MTLIKVADAAGRLGIRPQVVYKWVRQGKLKAKKVDKKTCVGLEEARQVHKKESENPSKGGRHLNWQALTDFLEASKSDKVLMEIDDIKEMIEAPKAKLALLHYWDPYRAQAKFGGQAPGLKAIRAADYELLTHHFDYVESVGLVGVVSIEVRKK